MPWKETDVMNLRTQFVLRALRGVEPFSELCQEFGISRKTGYKWKQRFFQQGLDGLADQSRKPANSPSRVSEDAVCQIVKLRLAHPTWGPKKLRKVLARSDWSGEVPSESTFKRVLAKADLIPPRRRRRTCEQGQRIENRVTPEAPNDVWTIDFKGWWYTRDRARFEPLTVRDDFSRFLLCTQAAADSKTETVQSQMRRVFESYGLPKVIRSDNGPPFASSSAPLGLSRLSAWWLTMGIDLDRIKPGRPDQNGGHERMHRDIAIELEGSAEADRTRQQASLDVWRETFNNERPHEAIGMQVPADLYQVSTRRYEPEEVELCYPAEHLVRKVRRHGGIRLRGMDVHISHALGGHHIGLEPLGPGRFSVWFCRLCLGELDQTVMKFKAAQTR